jgi:hypothetical protein
MNTNQNLKVLELRNYLLKPKTRERFVDYFENHFVDSQNISGGYVLGQFRIKDEDDKFFWMRGFEDMESRLAFLRGFYEKGEVWKTYGAGANEMMLDSDNVYLLKPLNNQNFNGSELTTEKGIFVIDYYVAGENQPDKLIDFFQTQYLPFLKSLEIQNTTLWVSEMSENNFPRLPVIQDENLLVAITPFRDESDYQSKLKQIDSARVELKSLITSQNSLILHPTSKSLTENANEKI